MSARLPTLTTRRLVLRSLELGDAAAVENLAGRDFEIARWMTSFSWPYQAGAAEAFLEANAAADPVADEAAFGVTLGGVLIGVVAIEAPGDLEEQPDCPTLGYWFGRPFHGFGYAREAAMAALEWGFEAHGGCPAIAARVFEENKRSRAVLRKLGFRAVGKTVRYAKPLDRKIDNIVMRLERGDFETGRKAA
ncbi:GNAT family N-acetyltransferase [Roseibium aquae]|nr:GNAT family N-acetyltransferase [Roseibium aquae]